MRTVLCGQIVSLLAIGMLQAAGSYAANKAALKMVTMKELAESTQPPSQQVSYKTIGESNLKLDVYFPDKHTPASNTPALVFLHGGGWGGGELAMFAPHCRYFASRGAVAFNVEYRLIAKKTTAFDCLIDCKSAVRYIRTHANEFGINPKKIAVLGASAGGHLAACLATITEVDALGEDTSISAMANATVLFDPIVDFTVSFQDVPPRNAAFIPAPWDGLTDDTKRKLLSPIFHVAKKQPPCLLIHGLADTVVPIAQCQRFAEEMTKAKNHMQFVAMPGVKHGFIYSYVGPEATFVSAMQTTDKFLAALGYLRGEPTVVMGEVAEK